MTKSILALVDIQIKMLFNTADILTKESTQLYHVPEHSQQVLFYIIYAVLFIQHSG